MPIYTGIKKSLPESYTQLAYIETTGIQCIDTGFKHNQDTRIVMSVQPGVQTTNAWLFEGRNSTSSARHGVFFYDTSTNFWSTDYHSSSRQAFNTIGATDYLNIDYDKTICTINGISKTHSAATFQSNYSLYLMACNTGGTIAGYAIGKLYSCDIYDDGIKIREYIPCINPNGVIGLYDMIENQFYGNAGDGNFIAGPNSAANSIARKVKDMYVSVPTEAVIYETEEITYPLSAPYFYRFFKHAGEDDSPRITSSNTDEYVEFSIYQTTSSFKVQCTLNIIEDISNVVIIPGITFSSGTTGPGTNYKVTLDDVICYEVTINDNEVISDPISLGNLFAGSTLTFTASGNYVMSVDHLSCKITGNFYEMQYVGESTQLISFSEENSNFFFDITQNDGDFIGYYPSTSLLRLYYMGTETPMPSSSQYIILNLSEHMFTQSISMQIQLNNNTENATVYQNIYLDDRIIYNNQCSPSESNIDEIISFIVPTKKSILKIEFYSSTSDYSPSNGFYLQVGNLITFNDLNITIPIQIGSEYKNIARKINNGYIGVNGIARLFYSSFIPASITFDGQYTLLDGTYTIDDTSYILYQLTSSGTLTVKGEGVKAWLCGGGGAGEGGTYNGSYTSGNTTVRGPLSGGGGGGGYITEVAALAKGQYATTIGSQGGATTLGSYTATGGRAASGRNGGSGNSGGGGGSFMDSYTTSALGSYGNGSGVSAYPFGIETFQPHAGGGGGGANYGNSPGRYYKGGAGGSDGSDGSSATSVSSSTSAKGGSGGAYGGGSGGSYTKAGSNATFYGGGGGGGGAAKGYNTNRAAGAGYQGVAYIAVPITYYTYTYTELEYIESNGSQYIDTKFKANQDTKIELNYSAEQEA